MVTTETNQPDHWLPVYPWPRATGHKYDRGQAIVLGGPWTQTGAAILSANAALRMGAGLVTVAADAESLPLYATHFQAVMTHLTESHAALDALISKPHVTALVMGPGAGKTEGTRNAVTLGLSKHKPIVIDADGLTVFADAPDAFFTMTHARTVVTPHAGEFAALFAAHVDLSAPRIIQAQQAAALTGSVVVLKGAQTVIAAADGRYRVQSEASPFLATAGSGDVLSGMIAGLLAQAMPAFEAACAAVWIHAETARLVGPGLISEDLIPQIREVVAALYKRAHNCSAES